VISNLPGTSKRYLAFSNLSVVSLAVMLMLLIVGFQYIPIRVHSQLPFIPPSTSPPPSGSNNLTATTTTPTNTQSSLIISSASKQQQQQQQPNQGQQQQPNINASYVYHTANMVLGNNIKNLVILLPNEDHEPPNYQHFKLRKDLRIINQTYVPDSVVVNPGTTVIWFSNDVGHLHKITLVDKSSNATVYDSGPFKNFEATKPVKLNSTGDFTFLEASMDPKYPDYVLNGTIAVNKQLQSLSSSSNSNNIDTVAAFMVPLNQQDKLISEFKSKGFGIDSTHVFRSVRGGVGGETCGDIQESLLILTSSGKSLNEVLSALQGIAPTMPCT
jgi:plastocyanin